MQCIWAFFLNTSEGVGSLNGFTVLQDCVSEELENIIHMGL